MARSDMARRAALNAAGLRWAAYQLQTQVNELTSQIYKTSAARPAGYRHTCGILMRELREANAKHRAARQAAHRAELEAGR